MFYLRVRIVQNYTYSSSPQPEKCPSRTRVYKLIRPKIQPTVSPELLIRIGHGFLRNCHSWSILLGYGKDLPNPSEKKLQKVWFIQFC